MRAMILAAGRGERMRPLTDNCPKPLLNLAGKKLIEYHLFALQKAGIKDVIINHAWMGDKIESYLEYGERYNLTISYSPEQQALETAGGIIQALPLLIKEEEQFLVINGDIFTDYDFSILVNHNLNAKAHLVMVNNPRHHLAGDFYLDNGFLSAVKQKDEKKLKYTFSGIGLYHASFFDGLNLGKMALAPILKQAMLSRDVSGELHQGLWVDVGTPKRLQQLERLILDK